MANGNGTTWFEAIMDLIYNELFNAGSKIYLPSIIQNGYTGDGLNIPPMDSTAVKDWSIADLKAVLPDSCVQGISQGDANFVATQQTLSGFHTVAQNGPLAFSNQDENLVINISVQSLLLSGSFTSNQNCYSGKEAGDWIESCSGTFACTVSNTDLTVNVSISVGNQLSISVDEIEASQITASDLQWTVNCPTCKFSQRTFFQNLLITGEIMQPHLLQAISDSINKFLNSEAVKNNIASIVNAQLAKI